MEISLTKASSFHLSEGIAVLERTPLAFHALLAELPESWTSAN